MKIITTTILFVFIGVFSNSIIGQQVNYDNLQSVVKPPLSYSPPFHPVSSNEITNGFENFFLGTDFGEPYIATNPRDLLNSICAFNINEFYYTLNGYTWIKNPVPFSGFGVLGDPVMCYDSLGNVFYMQLYQNGATYGLCVNKSTNKGQNWVGPYMVSSTTVGLSDKEWITADQTAGPFSNYLYAGWRQFGSSGMRFVRSTNGGVSWSNPLTLSGGQGAYVSVGPNGSIQGGSVYFACLGILVARSTDGGQTFGNQVLAATPVGPGIICAGRNTVKNCIRTDAFPRMAVDNSFTSTRGNVYITYADNPSGPDNADIFLVRSTDYGQTWSAPLRVNDDATTTDQWMPSISVDKNGKIFITWYDSRIDPTNNILTQLYGAVSTNGGVSFTPNFPVSNVPFNPNNMAVNQPGGEKYIGDYIGNSALNNVTYAVWMDGRNNSLGSYTGFYPDFAMATNSTFANLHNNDSAFITIKIPSIRGPFTSTVKFAGTLDSLPQSGSINISFVNGKDSITNFPDSVIMRVKTVGTVTPRLYHLTVRANGVGGLPVHVRNVDLLVNVSYFVVGTNRNGLVNFKVNGISYNTTQTLVYPNGSQVTVQAISPNVVGLNRYVFVNWSDAGDTTHSVTINNNVTLTANYKVQYNLVLNSSVGYAFGGGFYDSSSTATIYVAAKGVNYQGVWYSFAGWNGTGTGSYSSPDSSGTDTAHTFAHLTNPIVETARWLSVIGIKKLGTDVPTVYKLYQNYPNPFNPSTTINFDIVTAGSVKIVLYDILGKEVRTIVNDKFEPGKYNITFSAENIASGVYFYRIITPEFNDVKKMLIVK